MEKFYIDGINQRIKANLGFSSHKMRGAWRLTYWGRTIDSAPHAEGIARQYQAYVGDSQDHTKKKLVTVTINYDDELGFTLRLSENIPLTRHDNAFELSAEVMQLRYSLREVILKENAKPMQRYFQQGEYAHAVG
jgi:hypothetical protein